MSTTFTLPFTVNSPGNYSMSHGEVGESQVISPVGSSVSQKQKLPGSNMMETTIRGEYTMPDGSQSKVRELVEVFQGSVSTKPNF